MVRWEEVGWVERAGLGPGRIGLVCLHLRMHQEGGEWMGVYGM